MTSHEEVHLHVSLSKFYFHLQVHQQDFGSDEEQHSVGSIL